jgi:putative ABC transport system permease protein
MNEVVDSTLGRPRAVAALLAVFAAVGLALSAVGVYGVMAYSVAQRTREIGVRMALGATPDVVLRLILGQAVRLVAAGLGCGLACAAAATRLLDALLFETSALDPWAFAVTTVLLAVTAVLASLVPALRGIRVTPVTALRVD